MKLKNLLISTFCYDLTSYLNVRLENEQKKIMIFIAKSLTELSDLTNKLWKYPRPALDVLPKSLVLHNNVLKTC